MKLSERTKGFESQLSATTAILDRMRNEASDLEDWLLELRMSRPVKGQNWGRLEKAINQVIHEANEEANDFEDEINDIISDTKYKDLS